MANRCVQINDDNKIKIKKNLDWLGKLRQRFEERRGGAAESMVKKNEEGQKRQCTSLMCASQ